MIIFVKSEDNAVKNFGVIAINESGTRDISFLPIEYFDEFVRKNPDAEIRRMKKEETNISIEVPFGVLKNKPIQIEIQGEKCKFLIKI